MKRERDEINAPLVTVQYGPKCHEFLTLYNKNSHEIEIEF